MKRSGLYVLPILWLACATAFADPIHAIADGAYWHHDSGWVFPAKIAGFVLVGVPQDVAGSREAVAYYAREVSGSRLVVSVSVYVETVGTVHSAVKDDWRVVIRSQALSADATTLELLDAFIDGQRWDSLGGH